MVCLGQMRWLGCIHEQGCDDFPTWFCSGGTIDSTAALVPDSCGPTGWDECPNPPGNPPPCDSDPGGTSGGTDPGGTSGGTDPGGTSGGTDPGNDGG